MGSKLLHLHHLIVAILFIITCRSDCLNIPILFSKGANKGLKMVNSKSNEPTATRTRTAFASKRVHETLDPCVVLMKQLITKHQHLWVDEQIYSLAQGVVYWTPPETANEKISSALSDPNSALHTYAPDEGIPELISAIKEKLARENKLPEDGSCNSDDVQVIVTSGANQAYMNCVLTLLDEGDLSVVFKPYYFNHVMAIQMTRGNEALLVGPVDDDGYPSIVWLKEQFESEKGNAIKMITITNPGNPTGVSIPKQNLQEIVDLCREYEKIIVFDCTYEQFDHSSANAIPINEDLASEGFFCFSDEHVVNIFSFSKGYAMAGFRVGYVVVNTCGSEGKDIYEQMVKVQDTIPIATSRLSQQAALGALKAGRSWVDNKVKTLDAGRAAILDALSPLETTIGGSGAMYVMAKLPDGTDDMEFAELLIEKYGIAIIPGKFCGLPGWIRVCYSNLPIEECEIAAKRLKKGLTELTQ